MRHEQYRQLVGRGRREPRAERARSLRPGAGRAVHAPTRGIASRRATSTRRRASASRRSSSTSRRAARRRSRARSTPTATHRQDRTVLPPHGLNADGSATFKENGPCDTVNCSWRAPFSQLNLRISRPFRIGGSARVEAIAEVFNLFNAKNPFIPLTTRRLSSAGAPLSSFMQPTAYAGDFQQPGSGRTGGIRSHSEVYGSIYGHRPAPGLQTVDRRLCDGVRCEPPRSLNRQVMPLVPPEHRHHPFHVDRPCSDA